MDTIEPDNLLFQACIVVVLLLCEAYTEKRGGKDALELTISASSVLSFERNAEATPHMFNSGSRKLDTEQSRHLAVKQAISLMRTHFHEPLTLADIASSVQLSPFHFNRIFRSITGIPPSVYLAALRIEKAKKLLLRTRLSVTSICFDVGYNSLGTFTTRFTQFVGTNPTHLRQICQDREIQSFFRNWESLKKGLCTLKHCVERHAIEGYVSVPQAFDGLIFIGAFGSPIPQGKPVSCTVLAGPGRYVIPPLPQGDHYLFAAALQRSEDITQLLEAGSSLRCANQYPISIQKDQMQRSVNLVLSPMSWTDAPILIALPLLLHSRLQHCF